MANQVNETNLINMPSIKAIVFATIDAKKKKAEAEKAKVDADIATANRQRLYFDIGCFLWYEILYFDVLKHLQHKMDEQRMSFLLYNIGIRYMVFGPVKALTSAERREEFVRKAEAELFDRGYKVNVSVSDTGIIVRFI